MYYGGSRGTSTTWQPDDVARAQLIGSIVVGLLIAGTIGGLLLLFRPRKFDMISLAFVLKHKSRYVDGFAKLVADTDFSSPPGRAKLLGDIAGLISGQDVEDGYALSLPARGVSDAAATWASMLGKEHEKLSDVKLDYGEGQKATAAADQTAAETGEDRCVLSMVVTAWLKLGKEEGDWDALETLWKLSKAGSPGVDGVYLFYVPAAEEPLPEAAAKTILQQLRACDEKWSPENAATVTQWTDEIPPPSVS
jgi:hypothetical protein